MGLFSNWFGRDHEQSATSVMIDITAKRAQLKELSSSLHALVQRMRNPEEFPQENPGWQGRIGDLAYARQKADALESQPTFTREDLFDFGLSVRPLYRNEPPAEYRALAHENDRVLAALDALLT